MANWGANHGVLTVGHVGADFITTASMLRIPVCMHNVPEALIYRPTARALTVWIRKGRITAPVKITDRYTNINRPASLLRRAGRFVGTAMKKCFLVLDCGATNVRAIALDPEGNIAARAAVANESESAAENPARTSGRSTPSCNGLPSVVRKSAQR